MSGLNIIVAGGTQAGKTTLVRALVVPATMRLMGDWNWYAPAPIRRLVDRLGLAHVETPTPAAANGA